MVRLEGLGALKKINDPIGRGTRDLLACSVAPQPYMIQLIYRIRMTAKTERSHSNHNSAYRNLTLT
jgi:hypothetical protein